MAKYLLALYGDESGWEDVTPEDMKEGMEPWDKYGQAVTAAGVFLAGEGLQPSATATTVQVVEDGDAIVTDGPFVETKEQLGGFYLLECKDLDEALEWAKKVPLRPGGSIEVRPVMDYTQYGYDDPNLKASTAG
jgi:hypothetical protein